MFRLLLLLAPIICLFGYLEGRLVGVVDRHFGDRYPVVREFRRFHAFAAVSLMITSFGLLLAFGCFYVVAFGF